MSTEGTKGGDNRPGSRPEIRKLPTSRCATCGLVAVDAIVMHGACRNQAACQRRTQRRVQKAQGTVKTPVA